jgi:hypothetical protein
MFFLSRSSDYFSGMLIAEKPAEDKEFQTCSIPHFQISNLPSKQSA